MGLPLFQLTGGRNEKFYHNRLQGVRRRKALYNDCRESKVDGDEKAFL